MKKILSIILLIVIVCGTLTGCGSTSNEIKNAKPYTIDEVAGSRILAATTIDEDTKIYNYISDRIVVDGSKLIEVTTKDEQNITNLLANINTQLQGKGGNVLTDAYANYLLLEFAKTPFEWVQSNKNIVGFDPAARLYFVDVTYTTTDTYKSVVPDSKIVNGDPEGVKFKKKRYEDYITMLTAKYNNDAEKYNNSYNTFINRWGNIQDIFDEQQGTSLYLRTQYKGNETGGIGKLTYSGLVEDNRLAKGAKMTIRYVLKYALNLGEETDLSVEALYLKSYELNDYENILKEYTLKDVAALEVLKPFIDKLILSYNKAVEESNPIGLYQLFTDYSRLDKYYDEIREYTYNSIGAYNYEILERKNNGKEVAVKVNRVNQIRARGAEMSLPTYDEVLIFNLVLGMDDKITIKDIHLLSSILVGEPMSVIRNVTGISEQIQYSDAAFSEGNREKVEEALIKFSEVVTNSDYSSEAFLDVVDLGISQNTLNRMADTIKAISPKKKSTYIISWDTTTNVYCSVRIREIFECENGSYDTEAIVDLGNKNGDWKVVNYTRTLNIKTTRADYTDENALCIHERTAEGTATKIEETADKKDVSVNQPKDNKREEKPHEYMEEEKEEVINNQEEVSTSISESTPSTEVESSEVSVGENQNEVSLDIPEGDSDVGAFD